MPLGFVPPFVPPLLVAFATVLMSPLEYEAGQLGDIQVWKLYSGGRWGGSADSDQRTQKPLPLIGRVGSNPTFGTT